MHPPMAVYSKKPILYPEDIDVSFALATHTILNQWENKKAWEILNQRISEIGIASAMEYIIRIMKTSKLPSKQQIDYFIRFKTKFNEK